MFFRGTWKANWPRVIKKEDNGGGGGGNFYLTVAKEENHWTSNFNLQGAQKSL